MTRKIQKLKTGRITILQALAKGSTITKERTFPFGPVYRIVSVDGHRRPIDAEIVSEFAHAGYITCVPQDRYCDTERYSITTLGRQVAQDGGIAYEGTQLALLDVPVQPTRRSTKVVD